MISRRLLLDALCEAIFVAGSLRDLTDYDKWASPDPTKPTEIFIRTQLRHVNAVDLAQEIFDVDLSIQLRFVFKSSLSTSNKLFRAEHFYQTNLVNGNRSYELSMKTFHHNNFFDTHQFLSFEIII